MRSKQVSISPKIYIVVFDTGDEVVRDLTDFAKENKLHAASITAIGAFSNTELGYFDLAAKDYKKIPVTEQVEVLSLIGDITQYKGEPKLHAHVVVGKHDGTAHGGHLLKAIVNPTLEVVITEVPIYLNRELDPAVGIPLIKL